MAKLTENQKLGIVAGVAVLLSALGGGGVWWAKGLVEEKETSIGQMQTEIAAAAEKIRKIPEAEQSVIILRENLNEYVKILPEEKQLSDFLRVTQTFATQSQVNVRNFQPGRGGRSGNSAFEQYTYKFDFNGTLWQFMQFMNLFENYERFIQVKEFNLSSGASPNGEETVHNISMTVETYRYQPGSKGQDVAIANYAAKAEKLREEIFEAQQTIAREGYRFDGDRGRRDIFLDPRETAGSEGREVGPSPREQRKIIDQIVSKVSECQETYKRLQDPALTIFEKYDFERKLRERLVEIESQVADITSKGLISHAPLKLAWSREVVEPLSGLKQHATAAAKDVATQGLPREEMETLLARMKEDLKTGDMQAAIERCDILQGRIEVPKNDPRYQLFVDIEGLYLRAKLAEEFATIKLDISGIAVNSDGRSGIVLNGTTYEEGEYVDNNLLVKSVARDRVEFVYKGFTVVKIL